jgi:hypothetical protein
LERLEKIGFVPVGSWTLADKTIAIECSQHKDAVNVLYAFVVGGEPVYIGKTTQPLCKRMRQYRTPGDSQPTNNRNKAAIIEEIATHHRQVTLYVLPDNGLMYYGGFHLNLAAGLEDSLILELKPRWNGGKKEAPAGPVPIDPQIA